MRHDYQTASAAPARWFAVRAMTNRRSDRRLTYRISTGSTAGSSATMARSARRQTARATWSAAPQGVPPARMKFRSGGRLGLHAIDQLLEPLRRPRRRAALWLIDRSSFLPGSASCAPSANRSRCNRTSSASMSGSVTLARARPRCAFNSSTSPYAWTRGSSFPTRVPPKSDVSPVSPVRV